MVRKPSANANVKPGLFRRSHQFSFRHTPHMRREIPVRHGGRDIKWRNLAAILQPVHGATNANGGLKWDPEGRWLLERMQQTSARVTPPGPTQGSVIVADPHLAITQGGAAHIENHPPLIYNFDAKSEKSQKIHANAAFSNYRRSLLPERRVLVERYTLRDLAMKVVGVGSVGTLCAIGLFMTPDEEPLFLQVKEALCPILEKIAPPPEGLRQQGNRVVEGQRNMRAARCLSRLD